jgi:hypothetical protein
MILPEESETEPPSRVVANLRGRDAAEDVESDVPQVYQALPLLVTGILLLSDLLMMKLTPTHSPKVGNSQGASPDGHSIDAFDVLLLFVGIGGFYLLVAQIRKSRFVTQKDN